MNDVLEEIAKEKPITESDRAELHSLLQDIQTQGKAMGFSFTINRLVAIGHHLHAFLDRVEKAESLPAADPDMWNEISPKAKELSERIISDYCQKQGKKSDPTETFLLAVHFETSKFES